MSIDLSVIIPTHNPNRTRLERTLAGLKHQTLPLDSWELLIVDNATPDRDHVPSFDRSWHPASKIVREERIGLTRARLAGIAASQGNGLVFVDDDNVLHPDYLCQVVKLLHQDSSLGAIGGKSIPEFEVEPKSWVKNFYGCLALRDFGDKVKTYEYTHHDSKHHPEFAPIGAGMALSRKAATYYAELIESSSNRQSFDRTGRNLQSGGDCDINLTLLAAGWKVGYFPQLQLTHLIPEGRTTAKYLARLSNATSRSWVQVLDVHGIRPWRKIPRWGVIPRKIKAFVSYHPWSGPEAYIRWRSACGLFEGLGNLTD